MLEEISALYYVLSTAFCLIYIWKPKDDFNSHMDGIFFLIIGWIALPFYVIRLLIYKYGTGSRSQDDNNSGCKTE